ncbi:MAG: hypothetical protein U9Q94_04535 [Candidatus Bipolaricaulota bacterium]|nr:hypothetical protein [Candidatus Bipolaricaulota bacterium]
MLLIAANAGNTRYERRTCAGDDSAQVLRFGIACGSATAITPGTRIFTASEAKAMMEQISIQRLS